MGYIEQRRLTEDNLINLAGRTANEIRVDLRTYIEPVQTLSQIMANFEAIDVTQRRSFINNTMEGLIDANRNLMSIFSVWRPNELDGMDAFFANTQGTDESGQFIGGFRRERVFVVPATFGNKRHFLDLDFLALDALSGRILDPGLLIGEGIQAVFEEREDTLVRQFSYYVEVLFPIYRVVGLNQIHVAGIVGATVNLEGLQSKIREISHRGTGAAMVCTDKGFIVAHSNSALRGRLLEDIGSYDLESGENPMEVFNYVRNSIENQDHTILTTQRSLIVSYPLEIIVPQTFHARLGGMFTMGPIIPQWAVVTMVPMSEVMAQTNRLILISIFIVLSGGLIVGIIVFGTSKSLTKHTQNLQRSLEHSTTMHDNLKYGLFLMDKKFTIQGAYSKALEKILTVPNLQGKNFIDLIHASTKGSEREGILDYFDMVFKDQFDKAMLESINPISEFQYVSAEASEIKTLRTSFSLAEQGTKAYILGTMEDITAEKDLEKQLMEAESIRENEMRSIFQVIQLDPKVLSDFVADAEYEFEHINDALKNKRHLQQDLLIEMYQSIHAIKSNALILNLESFSDRLHKLENSIKNLQDVDKAVIPYDEFLGLILELNDAMKEIDRLKATVSKIENFRNVSGGDKNQERYVLVETLTRACQKTQAALDKRVKLVVEDIDDVVLDYGPRRSIRDILTQLIRNAVYHGIESPEERTPKGKPPEGEIRFSIKYRDNQIIIKLSDNGAGIDFSRIKQIASSYNLIADSEKANDKNYLLKAIFSPGFSTLDTADYHAGRGIGLSLVKDRVKALHGNITVSTTAGKGTSFIISLPLDLPAAANHAS
jgi:two-component system chemotaxis sensor kinase CheA